MSEREYTNGHLFVAAIRLFEHLNATPPTIDDVCRTLSISVEQGNLFSRKLEKLGVIQAVEGSYGPRLFIHDHLKLEEIPREEESSKLEEELKKFQESQKGMAGKMKALQVEQAKKKKDLFAEMEKKLKAELSKK